MKRLGLTLTAVLLVTGLPTWARHPNVSKCSKCHESFVTGVPHKCPAERNDRDTKKDRKAETEKSTKN